jgi:hypothetical protein
MFMSDDDDELLNYETQEFFCSHLEKLSTSLRLF